MKIIVFIFIVMFFIAGLNVVDRAVRDMMHIHDKQLYFFGYDDEFYRLHLLGRDYTVEKKGIDDRIDNAKVIIEDFAKLANNYLEKILTKIKTR
ncbi:hypothetical protein [Proteiniborus sp. MB09-C3]|uniref:hypothetical protein n=1 Tax=Proteiniborus sp. MB09-C3 TaxID=3050072 RepID=UPI002556A15A|nr:hypothetical protein [Proteiniborus sp. MB09-C3]WIV10678.1 hypothetical protein QO263_10970 [Proteiniborus sp. MB09-C3]